LHEELVMLSSNGTHIVVNTSNHFIYDSEPETVISAVLDIVAETQTQ
jgi:hypothetical protein